MKVILDGKDETGWGEVSMRNDGGTGKMDGPQIRPRSQAEHPATPESHWDRSSEVCDRAVDGQERANLAAAARQSRLRQWAWACRTRVSRQLAAGR